MTTEYQRVTIKQIAEEAGVSKQTVSRVLNNRPDVAPETRKRVQAIIEREKYSPSKVARALSRGRTFTLGIASSGLSQTGPSLVLTGIEAQAGALGYSLSLSIVYGRERSHISTILSNMLAQQVDGIIWSPMPKADENHDRIRQELASLSVPVVVIGADSHPDLTVVTVDDHLGGKFATEHLIENGYKSIGIITGDMQEWSARQRMDGWCDALETAGLPTAPSLIVEGDWSAASGDCGIRQLLKQRPDVDAVFVSNDQMALGALKAAQELGRKVPLDLGVVGYDDIPESSYFTPPLSTMRQALVEAGGLLVRELDRQIREEIRGEATRPVTIVLPPELIVRASSVPAPPAQELNTEGVSISA